jgi:hypothetical protein
MLQYHFVDEYFEFESEDVFSKAKHLKIYFGSKIFSYYQTGTRHVCVGKMVQVNPLESNFDLNPRSFVERH